MNWRLAVIILVALPLFAAAFHLLTGWLGPIAGTIAGLALGWLLMGALSFQTLDAGTRGLLLTHQRPPRLLGLLALAPVVIVAGVALASLGDSSFPPLFLVLVAVMALINGTLEEVFWRGALLPAPDREGVIVGWVLYVAWHLVFIFAQGVEMPGGVAMLLPGAAVMGAIWMALRLKTGTLGPAIASHVAFNLFLFADLAARNWPAAS